MAATTASCVLVGKAARQQGKRERHGSPRVPKHLRREHWCSPWRLCGKVMRRATTKVAKADR
eukprot:CAMPEP_0171101242 /NCGR_PEP_ID=MMETSP0766_2-20121228/54352_1 /TAXON_ID=439317 /ORGANISM="Gambierdiscus australes, Strain CAWD 149" /LENGTH=61 /DNA_ID=CAMNT_0011561233 /DNA_START=47 /DNA_END=229 /DNA_ORIENTATION=-